MNAARPAVGFVGVGRMGANMALRLHDLGYRIAAIYDLRPATAASVAAQTGSTAVRTPAEVTASADVVFTVVTDDAAMQAIFAADDDSLLRDAAGKVFINCATLTPQVHVEVAARARAAEAETLEACMASSIPQARNGTLFLMVAGSETVFERARPLLEDLSASLVYAGASGRAAQIKAIVNMVMNVNTAALAEGLGLGDALGIDLDLLRDILSKTGANSRVLETDGADMHHRDHDVFFSAAHAAKDCGIAVRLAESMGLDLPLAAATEQQYLRLVKAGGGELDKSGIAELTFRGRGAAGSRV